MTVLYTRQLAESIVFRRICDSFWPDEEFERVGFIYSNGTNYVFHEVPNRADNPRNDFKIWTGDATKVRNTYSGHAIAILHTHNMMQTKRPTRKDIEGLPDFFTGFVFHTTHRTMIKYLNDGTVDREPTIVRRPHANIVGRYKGTTLGE